MNNPSHQVESWTKTVLSFLKHWSMKRTHSQAQFNWHTKTPISYMLIWTLQLGFR